MEACFELNEYFCTNRMQIFRMFMHTYEGKKSPQQREKPETDAEKPEAKMHNAAACSILQQKNFG